MGRKKREGAPAESSEEPSTDAETGPEEVEESASEPAPEEEPAEDEPEGDEDDGGEECPWKGCDYRATGKNVKGKINLHLYSKHGVGGGGGRAGGVGGGGAGQEELFRGPAATAQERRARLVQMLQILPNIAKEKLKYVLNIWDTDPAIQQSPYELMNVLMKIDKFPEDHAFRTCRAVFLQEEQGQQQGQYPYPMGFGPMGAQGGRQGYPPMPWGGQQQNPWAPPGYGPWNPYGPQPPPGQWGWGPPPQQGGGHEEGRGGRGRGLTERDLEEARAKERLELENRRLKEQVTELSTKDPNAGQMAEIQEPLLDRQGNPVRDAKTGEPLYRMLRVPAHTYAMQGGPQGPQQPAVDEERLTRSVITSLKAEGIIARPQGESPEVAGLRTMLSKLEEQTKGLEKQLASKEIENLGATIRRDLGEKLAAAQAESAALRGQFAEATKPGGAFNRGMSDEAAVMMKQMDGRFRLLETGITQVLGFLQTGIRAAQPMQNTGTQGPSDEEARRLQQAQG